VKWIFEKNGTQLVVLDTDVSAKSSEAGELVEDLLLIITVFVARHNEMCSATNRRRQEQIQEQEFQNSSRQDTMYPSLFYTRREVNTQTLDGNSMMNLQSVSCCSQKRGYHVDKKSSASTMSQRHKFQ